MHELTALPDREGGLVGFENYLRHVWLVTWDEVFLISEGGKKPHRMELDELVGFTKNALYGPNRASGESAFTPHY
nr:hypothetical protein GCM10020241_08390 [Streptoalloteichus tenebrarius]